MLQDYRTVIMNMSDTLNTVVHNQWIPIMRADLTNTLDNLENVVLHDKWFRQAVPYHRDLAEIGHLTESLISPTKLQTLLNQIRSELTPSYLYTHFTVRLLSLTLIELEFLVYNS